MSEILILDLKKVTNQASFHTLVSNLFSFPEYYGRNKDAFWDCITEIVDKVEVHIIGLENLSDELRAFVASYIKLLHEYEQESGGNFKTRAFSGSSGDEDTSLH